MAESYHDAFAAALFGDGGDDFIAALQPGGDARRFAVYRNNVVRGGVEALRAAYPAVNRLVGDAFFTSMARDFWYENPPRSRSLTLYGAGFDSHIRGYGPAKDLPYLPGVAALDRAWLVAHHAAESPALEPGMIARMPPENLPVLAPGLRPCVQLVGTDWTCFEIWRGNRFDATPPGLKVRAEPETSVVWRPGGDVRFATISSGEHAFLMALGDGLTLEQAAADGASIQSDFNPAETFGQALQRGLLAGHD